MYCPFTWFFQLTHRLAGTHLLLFDFKLQINCDESFKIAF